MPVIEEKRLTLNHQFDFRSKHATVDQIHRITNKIILAFEGGSTALQYFLMFHRLLTRYDTIASRLKSNNVQKNFMLQKLF
jgi:hypothetical protein